MNLQTNSKKQLSLPGQEAKKSKEPDEYLLMDLEDERQIREEFAGRFVDEYVYTIEVNTKSGKITLSGLSYAGTKEMVKQVNLGGKGRYTATDIPPTVEEHETYWLAKVQCEDKVSGLKIWGVKKQNKRKSGGQIDEHAEAIAVSKAQRNGLQGLIPKGMVNDFIQFYLGNKKGVKNITPPASSKSVTKTPPQPIDARDFLETSVFNIADKLSTKMNLTLDAIINKELNTNFKGKELKDLNNDELKGLIRDLSAKYNKLVKTTTEAASVQQTIEES